MKKKFAFDSMGYDVSDISEDTIVEDTGIDIEKVVDAVMKNTVNKKIRRFSRKGIIGIAAAAAVIAVVGTATVGAAGGFNQAFGNWFAGEPKYGLFSGDNVSCTSETAEIDFLGIAGDDNFVGASMTIKSKDGSPFVNDAESDYVIYGSNNVEVSLSPIASLVCYNSNRGGSVWYKFDNENTIRATVLFQDENCHLKGEKMTIKENNLLVYRLGEVVGDYKNDYEELSKKYAKELGGSKTLFFYSKTGAYEDNKYYIADETQIPLDFEVNVTLNYKSTSRAMEVIEGKELEMDGVKLTIDGLEAKSFGIDIKATVGAMDFPAAPELDGLDAKETAIAVHDYNEAVSKGFDVVLDITMKDGSHITAEGDSRLIGANSETSTSGTINCVYKSGNSYIAIDPDQIETVTAAAKASAPMFAE